MAAASLRADWTGVASAATIDEGDLNKIELNNDGSATIRATITSTSAKIRFNVVPTPALQPPPPGAITGGLIFSMRYRDNGSGARVIATIKRITLAGWTRTRPQANTIIATIDSDLEPPSNAWQTAWAQHANCSECGSQSGLDALDFGYVVEVQLIKHDSTGNPGIVGVQLFRET